MKNNYTFPITKDMAVASSTLRISTTVAQKICRKISRHNFSEAKKALFDASNETKTIIRTRFHTKTASEMYGLIKVLEANADAKGLDPESMILFISAHQGAKMMRGRRKRRFGLRLKNTNVQAVLKNPEKKKVKKEGSDKKALSENKKGA